jgi:hypothetical protein
LKRRNISDASLFAKGVTMNRYFRSVLLVTGASLALAAISAGAAVTVTFTKPDGYADMPFTARDKEHVMKDLKTHFDKLGAQLPQDQDLKIEILDIDLAGRIEPRIRNGEDIRVLRGAADWPMIQLRYSIESGGKVVRSGEARVSDMSYLNHLNRYSSGEPLRYEKSMLDDWFNKLIKQ